MPSIAKGLDRALSGAFTKSVDLDLDSPHKYIIFSDLHKGTRVVADEFRHCEPAYLLALAPIRICAVLLMAHLQNSLIV